MALMQATFYSAALMRTVTVNVLMPTDRFAIGSSIPMENRPKKTLYLLHGVMGSFGDWVNRTRVEQLSSAHDLAVVMPSGDNKFYCDSEISGDRYGTFIAEELVLFTRDTFNLSRKREDTYIGGLSMGGFGALTNALRHPETFSRVCAFSSALIKDKILSSVEEPGHDLFTRTQYCTMFGLKRIEDFAGSDRDYEALAEKLAASGKQKPLIYMACGRQDTLFDVNTAYRDKLRALGYDVTWTEIDGVHEWRVWDDRLEDALNWLPLDDAVEGTGSGNVGI